jgi:hypothetical protein
MMPFSSFTVNMLPRCLCTTIYPVCNILPRGLCHCRCGATNQTGVGREDLTSSGHPSVVAKK